MIFQNGAGKTYAVAVDTEFLEPAPPADGILLLPIDWTKLANYFAPATVASVVEYALAKLRWITVPDQHSIVDAFLAQEQKRTLQRKAEADLEKASVPKPSTSPAGSPASQWTWTGQSASGQAAEDLRSLIVRHYKDGAFRAYGMRVDYWQILSEAKAHAGSSIRVEDAVADWKHRYKLGANDTTIWRVLTHARAVALRPAK